MLFAWWPEWDGTILLTAHRLCLTRLESGHQPITMFGRGAWEQERLHIHISLKCEWESAFCWWCNAHSFSVSRLRSVGWSVGWLVGRWVFFTLEPSLRCSTVSTLTVRIPVPLFQYNYGEFRGEIHFVIERRRFLRKIRIGHGNSLPVCAAIFSHKTNSIGKFNWVSTKVRKIQFYRTPSELYQAVYVKYQPYVSSFWKN